MAIIARDFPDLLLDAMVSALETFRDEQAAVNPAVTFSVERDRLRPYPEGAGPSVNLWIDEDLVDDQDSGARRRSQQRVTVNIDLICQLPGNSTARADKAAGTRLHYLRAQARHALYKLVYADFGFSVGTIARKEWPRWQTFQTPDKMPEGSVPGGRLVIEVEYEFTPEDRPAAPALEILTVDDDNLALWATTFDYTDT